MECSLRADAGTHLPISEGRKAECTLAEKKVMQGFKSRQNRGSNQRPCGWKTEILLTVPTTPPLI